MRTKEPVIAVDQWTQIAWETRTLARLRVRYPNPDRLARGLGVQVRRGALEELGVLLIVTGHTIIVQDSFDARERGWLTFCGIAQVVLDRRVGPYNAADVAGLARELGAPVASAARWSFAQLSRRQPSMPLAVLRLIAGPRAEKMPRVP